MVDNAKTDEIVESDSLVQIVTAAYTVYRSLCKDSAPMTEKEFYEKFKSYAGQFFDFVKNGS